MSAWDVLPPGEVSSITTLSFQTSGQEAETGSSLVFQPTYVPRIVFIKQKTSKEPVLGEFINAAVSINQQGLHIRMWCQLPEMYSFNVVHLTQDTYSTTALAANTLTTSVSLEIDMILGTTHHIHAELQQVLPWKKRFSPALLQRVPICIRGWGKYLCRPSSSPGTHPLSVRVVRQGMLH